MPFTALDATSHTGHANTPARQRVWADAANRILAATGDRAKAIRLANASVYAMTAKSTQRRVRLLRVVQTRLL